MGSQVSSVALLHHQVTRVNMLTGQLLSLSGGLLHASELKMTEMIGPCTCLLTRKFPSQGHSLSLPLSRFFVHGKVLLLARVCSISIQSLPISSSPLNKFSSLFLSFLL